MKVREIMRPASATLAPDASLKEVMDAIETEGLADVAVVDEAGQFLGVVGVTDIFQCIADLSRGGVEDMLTFWRERAASLISRRVMGVDANDETAVAITKMRQRNVTRLAVTLGGRLVGYVNRDDLQTTQPTQELLGGSAQLFIPHDVEVTPEDVQKVIQRLRAPSASSTPLERPNDKD